MYGKNIDKNEDIENQDENNKNAIDKEAYQKNIKIA